MAPIPIQTLRPLVIAGFLGLMAPTWSLAQVSSTDRSGLYDPDLDSFMRSPTTTDPRPGEFKRRIPKGTSSRFSSGFRNYMRDLGSEAPERDPDPIVERQRERASYDFDFGNGEEDPLARLKESSFRHSRTASRFSEKEQETRHESYLRYLKERDPSLRAKLFRAYVKAGTGAPGDGDQAGPKSSNDPSSPAESTTASPLGFGSSYGRPSSSANAKEANSTFDRTARDQGSSRYSSSPREAASEPSSFRAEPAARSPFRSTRNGSTRSSTSPVESSSNSTPRAPGLGSRRDR